LIVSRWSSATHTVDSIAARLTFEQTEALRRLSRQVLTVLELRRRLIEHDRTIRELDQARHEAATQKARAEELLDNLLPAVITEELKKNGRVQPRYIRSATVLFADLQGFTLLAERAEPAALVGLLDQYFTAFDDIVARRGLEKIRRSATPIWRSAACPRPIARIRSTPASRRWKCRQRPPA
jgi:adenylate cyclase